MSATAHATLYPAPVAYFQRWIEPQARHNQGQESQTEPALRAVLIVRTVARMLGKVAFRIGCTMVTNALGTADARYRVDGRFNDIRSVQTRPLRIVLR